MFSGRFLVAIAMLFVIGEAAILMVFGAMPLTTIGGYAIYALWVAGISTGVLLLFHPRKVVGLSFGGMGVAVAVMLKTAVALRAVATGVSRWWGSERVQVVWAQLREDTLILGLFSLIVACLGWYVFVFMFPAQSENVTDKIKEVYKKITTGFLVMTPSSPAQQHARVASSPTVQASSVPVPAPANRQIGNDPLLATLLSQGLVNSPTAAPAVPQKTCPLCSRATELSSKFCPDCGFSYTVSVSSGKTERVSLVCGHCRTVATRPGNICSTCGHALIPSTQPATQTQTHCSGCHDKLEPGAEWCVSCGKKVT